VMRTAVQPSPLVGEGGEIERSEMKPGEGFLSAETDPSSGSHLAMRATFSHKGRRKVCTRGDELRLEETVGRIL
jgi:hypothetical protein